MNHLGYARLAIADIDCGDLTDYLNDPETAIIGDSFGEVGQLNTVTVRVHPDGRRELLAGKTRVAAHMLVGNTHVQCSLYEFGEAVGDADPDATARKVTLIENVARKHDPKKRKKQLGELARLITEDETALAKALHGPAPRKKASGHPVTARTKAVRAVAALAGVSETTVAYALRDLDATPAAPPAVEVPIPTYGQPLTPEYLEELRTIGRMFESFVRDIDRMLASLEGAAGLAMHRATVAKTTAAFGIARVAVQHGIPGSLCPWCKAVGGITGDCKECEGTGWVSAEKLMTIPSDAQLLDPIEAWVWYDGSLVRLADIEDADDV